MLAFQQNRPISNSKSGSTKQREERRPSNNQSSEKRSFKIKTNSMSPNYKIQNESIQNQEEKRSNNSRLSRQRPRKKSSKRNSRKLDNITHQRIKEIVSRKNSRSQNRRSGSNFSSNPNNEQIRRKENYHYQMKRDKLSRYFSKEIRGKQLKLKDTDSLLKNFKSVKKKRGKSLGDNNNNNNTTNNLHLLNSTLQRRKLHHTISSKFSKNGLSGENLGNNGNQRKSFYQKFLSKKMKEGRTIKSIRSKQISLTGNLVTFKPKKTGTFNNNKEKSDFSLKRKSRKSSSYGGKRSDSLDFGKGIVKLSKNLNKVEENIKNFDDANMRKSISRNRERRRSSIKSNKSRKKSSERKKNLTPKIGKNQLITPLGERLEELKNQINPKRKSGNIKPKEKDLKSESLYAWKQKKEKKSGNLNITKDVEKSNKREEKHINKEDEEQVKISDFAPKPIKKKREFTNLNFIRKNEAILPYIEKSKVIIKKFGSIEGFAVNTHVGLIREYNEDRVSILLNAQQR